MPGTNHWIVGCDSTCDVIIDAPTVSSQHCKLTKNGSGYDLEDLASTNGTFINGSRVTTKTFVTTSDRITLGQNVPLPWNRIEQTRQQVISIGRLADNDVVLSDVSVSGHHARIVIDGPSIVIEDLGSTNGTAISKPSNRISSARLRPSDTVYFGDHQVLASSLIHNQIDQTVMVQAPISATEQNRSAPWKLVAVGATIFGSIIVAALTLFLIQPWRRDVENNDVVSVARDRDDVEPREIDVPKADTSSSPAPQPTFEIEDAVFSLLACDREQALWFRLGTAFAVSSRQLVTSAFCVQALKNIEEKGYSVAFALSDRLPKREFRVVSKRIHPKFEKKYQSFSKIVADLRTKTSRLQEEQRKEALETLQHDLVRLETQHLDAMHYLTFYDVAVLEVDQDLPTFVSLSTTRLSTKTVEVYGYPAKKSDPNFDVAKQMELKTMQGEIKGTVLDSQDRSSRIAVSTQTEQTINWWGSPVVADGRVIAIYSHPTFHPEKKDILRKQFDAPVVKRIGEIIPNLVD